MQDKKAKTKKLSKRLLEYVLIPIAFTLLSFTILFGTVNLFAGDAMGYINMFLFKEPPSFTTKINDIFTPSTYSKPTLPLEEVKFPEFGDVFGRIEISSIKLSCPLIYGDDDFCLKKGAGQYNGSFIPGYGGTTLISGHNYYPFQNLKNVKKGDYVRITTTYGVYVYKVVKTAVKTAEDETAYDLGATYDNVILYTCIWHDSPVGNIKMRFFVYGDYVSGPRLIK